MRIILFILSLLCSAQAGLYCLPQGIEAGSELAVVGRALEVAPRQDRWSGTKRNLPHLASTTALLLGSAFALGRAWCDLDCSVESMRYARVVFALYALSVPGYAYYDYRQGDPHAFGRSMSGYAAFVNFCPMTVSVLIVTLLNKKYFAPLIEGWSVISCTALIYSLWLVHRARTRPGQLSVQPGHTTV